MVLKEGILFFKILKVLQKFFKVRRALSLPLCPDWILGVPNI